jgi:hypothetical protein
LVLVAWSVRRQKGWVPLGAPLQALPSVAQLWVQKPEVAPWVTNAQSMVPEQGVLSLHLPPKLVADPTHLPYESQVAG